MPSISTKDPTTTEIEAVLDRLWSDSNRLVSQRSVHELNARGRLKRRSKLDTVFYSRQMKPVGRLAVAWLVDGAEPNPVYFNRPDAAEIAQRLDEANVPIFSDTVFVKKRLEAVVFDEVSSDLVISAIRGSWLLVNPDLGSAKIEVFLEGAATTTQFANSTRSKRQIAETGLGYFVGVSNAGGFDVSDVNEPSGEVVGRELLRSVPGLKFLAGGGGEQAKDQSRSSLMLIVGSSVGGVALVVIGLVLVAALVRR